MKAVFFGCTIDQKKFLETRVAQRGLALDLVWGGEKLDADTASVAQDAPIISVFVGSPVNAEALSQLPNLKLLTTRSTGFDHIDTAQAKKQGITVSYVPSYGENTVAEHAFALLLALSKRICEGYDQVREEGDFRWQELQGFDLKGKTIGIVGLGHIGYHAAKIARGFDMQVLAYDLAPREELAKELGFSYVPLDVLLAQSDIVTLHLSLNESTRHLINKKTLALMKRGSVLINTSRGAIVDTMALVKALSDGHLAGAGLDVLEEEGIIRDEQQFVASGDMDGHNLAVVLADHTLINMPNVIVTPHIAFNTKEAVERILETTLDSIEGFLHGTPANVVPA
jgi:D-lactate dehydrogenase